MKKFLIHLSSIVNDCSISDCVYVEAETEEAAALKLGLGHDEDDKAFYTLGDVNYYVVFQELSEVSNPEHFNQIVQKTYGIWGDAPRP